MSLMLCKCSQLPATGTCVILLWHGPGTSRGLLECSLLYCENVLTLTAEQSTLRACYCFAGGILGMRNIYCRGWVGYHADYHGIR